MAQRRASGAPTGIPERPRAPYLSHFDGARSLRAQLKVAGEPPAVEVHSNADTEPILRYLRASGEPELVHDTVRARHTLSCEETSRTRL